MRNARHGFAFAFVLIAAAAASCVAPRVTPTMRPAEAPVAALWELPADVADRDLFFGPWGQAYAPDPQAEYTFVRPKQGGINPGLVVRDPAGREWHIKQAPASDRGDEGPSEVVLSRVLSAAGYRQPPVYYLKTFTLRGADGTRLEPGGRFRLDVPALKDIGEWSWQQNPFVGMRPYQGLLAILMMFNSTDLKNSNNTLYERTDASGRRPMQWYVVRDLGNALGETGRMSPKRNNVAEFTRTRFVKGVERGFVVFDFNGLHQELVRSRITPGDLGWASAMLAPLTERQWQDAFRAGGYTPAVASQFISALRSRVARARQIGANAWPGA